MKRKSFFVKIFGLLPVSFLIVNIGFGQKINGAFVVKVQPPYSGSVSQISKIDEDHFSIILPYDKHDNELIIFNKNLTALFRKQISVPESVTLFDSDYYTIKANKERIVILKNIKINDKKECAVNATVLNSSNGSVINSKNLDLIGIGNGTQSYVFSNDKEFFGFIRYSEDNTFMADVFNSSNLLAKYHIEYRLGKKEYVVFSNISKSGKFVIAVSDVQSRELKLIIYDSFGKVAKTIYKPNFCADKETYDDFSVFSDTKSENDIFFLQRVKGNKMQGIEVWEIDYNTYLLKNRLNFSISKDFIKDKLFSNKYPRFKIKNEESNLVSKKDDQISVLDLYHLNNMFINNDGSINLIFEGVSFSNVVYNASMPGNQSVMRLYITRVWVDPVFLMSFTCDGKNNWNSSIDRTFAYQQNGRGDRFFPDNAGVNTIAEQCDSTIKIVLPEMYGLSSINYTLRTFRKRDGKLISVKAIVDDSFINTYYSSFLNANTFVAFKLNGANRMGHKDFSLLSFDTAD